MQAKSKINVAVLPFMKGEIYASVCSDGNNHAVITNGVHQKFTSLWWAVEYARELGFKFDRDAFKASALTSFLILCAPHGYYYKHVGTSWHGFRDGRLVACEPTRFACQVRLIRNLIKCDI